MKLALPVLVITSLVLSACGRPAKRPATDEKLVAKADSPLEKSAKPESKQPVLQKNLNTPAEDPAKKVVMAPVAEPGNAPAVAKKELQMEKKPNGNLLTKEKLNLPKSVMPGEMPTGPMYYVQVSSFQKKEMAMEYAENAKTSEVGVMVEVGDLGDRGTWYRVIHGPFTKKGDAQGFIMKQDLEKTNPGVFIRKLTRSQINPVELDGQ